MPSWRSSKAKQSGAQRFGSAARKERPRRSGARTILEGNQDEDASSNMQIAAVLRSPVHLAAPPIMAAILGGHNLRLVPQTELVKDRPRAACGWGPGRYSGPTVRGPPTS